mmetsp:Transcript_8402/g.7467  ORF Transcript_8402/g.7467 Transcript_8402/m.7467 type:complete len:107 (-) Transcript_8402:115-435(-)
MKNDAEPIKQSMKSGFGFGLSFVGQVSKYLNLNEPSLQVDSKYEQGSVFTFTIATDCSPLGNGDDASIISSFFENQEFAIMDAGGVLEKYNYGTCINPTRFALDKF